MTVELTYSLTMTDMEAHARFLADKNPFYSRNRDAITGWILAIFVVVAIAFGYAQGAVLFVLISLLGAILAWWHHRTYSRRFASSTKSLYQTHPKPGMFDTRTVSLSESGVIATTENARTEYSWSAFVGWTETDWAILLMVSSLEAIILPRDRLDAIQLDTAKTIISKYVVAA